MLESAITDLTEFCPREGAEKSLHLQDHREAQNISGKAPQGRADACVGRTANADSWQRNLLLNGKSPKPVSQQGAQVSERKKTQPNPGEAEFGLPRDGLGPTSKAPV